jgi:transcriptional regulator with XRE-family HTH domain
MSHNRKSRAQVRRLFAAGASVRAVLVDADVKQRQIAELSGVKQSRVAKVLAGETGSTRAGQDMARRVFVAVAELLGVAIREIPEAEPLT